MKIDFTYAELKAIDFAMTVITRLTRDALSSGRKPDPDAQKAVDLFFEHGKEAHRKINQAIIMEEYNS